MAVEGAARSGNPADRIGKYEIVSKIGQGAMGEVYKARDTVLDRYVAIKTMSPAVLGNPEIKARFFASGIETVAGSPEAFADRIRNEMAVLGKVIRQAGIRAD